MAYLKSKRPKGFAYGLPQGKRMAIYRAMSIEESKADSIQQQWENRHPSLDLTFIQAHQVQLNEQVDAKIRRRFHVSGDVLLPIGVEGFEKHWSTGVKNDL